MSNPIRLAIVGYGNLGRGVEKAAQLNPDFALKAVFTRRDPATVHTAGTPVYSMSEMANFRDQIDVAILCGGSATDLMEQGPEVVNYFNVVDSYDTHARIPEHFAHMDAAAKAAGHTAIISSGWDPGLFSYERVLFQSLLPQGETVTFWGKGVSQGHSDAIRRVPGVAAGVQYTIPQQEAVDSFRSGKGSNLTTREKHARECYVVLNEGADAEKVRETIVTMPNYFSDYNTTVHFISNEEFQKNHKAMPHGGMVLRHGTSSEGTEHLLELKIKLDSNPEFTSSILVATARALNRMAAHGGKGAFTLLDIAPSWLSPKTAEELRAQDL